MRRRALRCSCCCARCRAPCGATRILMRVRSLAATPTFPSHPPPPPSFSPLVVQAERRAGVPRHRLPAGLVDLPRHARLFDVQPVRRQRGRGRFVGRPVRRRRVGAHRVPHVRHDARGVWRQVRRRLRSIEVARLRPRASDARACARASPQVGPGTEQRRVGTWGDTNGSPFGVSTLLTTQVQSVAWASSPTCTCAPWASRAHWSP